MLNEKVLSEFDKLRGKYHSPQSLLLPALYLAQREYGWLSPDVLSDVSAALNVPKAIVKGVSSFYAMFIHKPMGRHLIQLCTNVACMLMGAERLVDILKERYGLEPNSTTSDGRFSLVIMECIGACGSAPAMLVNTNFYENLTAENILMILEKYK